MISYICNKELDNINMYNLFHRYFPYISKDIFFKYLRNKDFKLNGKRIKDNCILRTNDHVDCYIPDSILFNVNIDILFEDDNVLIVYKSSNMLTGNEDIKNIRAGIIQTECSLLDILLIKYNYEYLMPCHRLDRNTEGIVIYAKSQIVKDEISSAFKQHKVHKKYIAYVTGNPKENEKLIAYLKKVSKSSLVNIYDKKVLNSSEIRTNYTLLKKYGEISKLDVDIETGKTHQIRAHLAHIGLPIIGDTKYGDFKINKIYNINIQQLFAYSINFVFCSDSELYYLNDINIHIDIPEIQFKKVK